MSKGGGAGKVYFVLYLAVVLELLIIIVERDEAEEGLLKKQRESMKIVESILSQMQAGSGTEGINTRPQDEITILDKADEKALGDNIQIKSSRKYIVEVGVTDVSNDLKKGADEPSGDFNLRLKKLVELSNVDEIEYQVFYNSSTDPNNSPMFPSGEELTKNSVKFTSFTPGQTLAGPDASTWEFMSLRKLKLDKDATYNALDLQNLTAEAIKPIYPASNQLNIGPSLIPPGMPDDSAFFYSVDESLKRLGMTGGTLKKRAFVVNFQPPSKAGYYILRFASRTNRILGVRGDSRPEDVNDETKINIGTVQLTVGALNKVKKELVSKLEKFSLPAYEMLSKEGKIDEFDEQLKKAKEKAGAESASDVVETRGKIELYGYICKLLAPGQSSNFSQNRGSIEFIIRVITPKPKTSEPTVIPPQTDVACFDKIPAVFDFTISPYQGEGQNNVTGRVLDKTGNVVARVDCKPLDLIDPKVAKPTMGGRREYRGIIDKVLGAGEYEVYINHTLSGKPKEETVHMAIFPSGLTDASKGEIDGYMDSKTLYGNYLTVKAIASSGGKIRNENFRIELKTDKDSQKDPFVGLSMSSNDRVYLPADAQIVSLKIWWIQPGTGQIVELYPENSKQIRQKPPTILTENAPVSSGTTKKVRVMVKNISVLDPAIGVENDPTKKANVKVKVGDPKCEIPGFDINGEAGLEGPEEGGKYTVTIDLSGSMARGEEDLIGSISFYITAIATNPINGKSEQTRKRFTIPVNFTPEKEVRRTGGGARPAPGPAPKQPPAKKK